MNVNGMGSNMMMGLVAENIWFRYDKCIERNTSMIYDLMENGK